MPHPLNGSHEDSFGCGKYRYVSTSTSVCACVYLCACMCVCVCVCVCACMCVCVCVSSEQVLALKIALRHFICTTHAQFFSSPLVAHAVNIVVELLMQSVEVLVRHSVVSMSTRQLSSTTLTNHNCWTILSSVIKKCMPQLFLHFWCTL